LAVICDLAQDSRQEAPGLARLPLQVGGEQQAVKALRLRLFQGSPRGGQVAANDHILDIFEQRLARLGGLG
jgi:hypothetical protein